jgi:hypothetical protein
MVDEQKDVIEKIKELNIFINNYEEIFFELALKNKTIPEDFLNTYLEIISEKEKKKTILQKIKNEPKNLLELDKTYLR